uniref:IMD domain-containing protein n=1 Tax=Moniliophthora roreri TaxID=221103 RepID=A0A0W0F8K1_MONRR
MSPGRPRSLRAFAFGSSRRNSSPDARSPSPTFSDTTNVSGMNFGVNGPSKIITRADLKASLQAYEHLMNTCADYRQALITLSKSTAAFADAMEKCSGLKGPTYETGTRLQAASGLHHLIGNHYHVLAETLDKNFEKPLRQHLDTYRIIVTERSASYERALKGKSEIIRQTERRNMNRKERNLQSFREALAVLQRQVDELDELKAGHYQEIIEHEEEVWDVVQGKVCLVVRSTLDVFDRFTSKATKTDEEDIVFSGLDETAPRSNESFASRDFSGSSGSLSPTAHNGSDPIIEPMLQAVPDPFDSYGMPQSEDQIFSILPRLSIIPSVPSSTSTTTPLTRTPELENIEGLPPSTSTTSGWVPNATSPNTIVFPTESAEWADVPSPSTSPRTTSPSSRRHSTPGAMPVHSHRKSESKLRSVLSVIDETHIRNGNEEDTSRTPQTDNKINGSSLIQPQPQKRPMFSWTSPFSYSQPAADDTNHDDTTPRNSTIIHTPSSPSSPPQEDVKSDDDTIHESNHIPVAT